MGHVEQMVSHGPHPPGSQAQAKVGDYILQTLRSYGLDVHTYGFEPATPQGRVKMRNIWGVIEGKKEEVILLASHYDSKYFEGFEFVGANDSGSSSGLLLELARILSEENPTDYTLWLVFFDGEEAFQEWTELDSLYGSREFVRMLKRRNQLGDVRAMILLDLIGGENLSLLKDAFSTAWLKEIIWRKGQEVSDIFKARGSTAAVDDHIPFSQEGIPVVDIIDLNYPHWHTAEDTPGKLSPRNIEIVGNVVLASLPEVGEYLEFQFQANP